MKKTRYTEEQIAFALKQAQTGTRVGEVCRKMGISEATFYNWKKKFAGLGVTELRRPRTHVSAVYSQQHPVLTNIDQCGRRHRSLRRAGTYPTPPAPAGRMQKTPWWCGIIGPLPQLISRNLIASGENHLSQITA
jgi:putative transposase